MDDDEYVTFMADTVSRWPIDASATSVDRLVERSMEMIRESTDVSLIEAIVPQLVITLGEMESRIVALETGNVGAEQVSESRRLDAGVNRGD